MRGFQERGKNLKKSASIPYFLKLNGVVWAELTRYLPIGTPTRLLTKRVERERESRNMERDFLDKLTEKSRQGTLNWLERSMYGFLIHRHEQRKQRELQLAELDSRKMLHENFKN